MSTKKHTSEETTEQTLEQRIHAVMEPYMAAPQERTKLITGEQVKTMIEEIEQEQYSEEQIQEAQASLTETEVQEMEYPFRPTAEEIAGTWDSSELQPNDKAIALRTDTTIVLAEGLTVDLNAPDEEIDAMVELIQSYVGVKPEKVGDNLGEWLLCIGCALVPFERDVKRKIIVEGTGEVLEHTVTKRWKAPLFKLAEKNKQGQYKVLSGGGGNAVDFIKRYAQLGRAGDWRTPKEIMFSSEERTIENEQGEKVPGRMYRIDVRTPQGK